MNYSSNNRNDILILCTRSERRITLRTLKNFLSPTSSALNDVTRNCSLYSVPQGSLFTPENTRKIDCDVLLEESNIFLSSVIKVRALVIKEEYCSFLSFLRCPFLRVPSISICKSDVYDFSLHCIRYEKLLSEQLKFSVMLLTLKKSSSQSEF